MITFFKVLKLKTDANTNIFYSNLALLKLKKEIKELLSEVKDLDAVEELISFLKTNPEDSNIKDGYSYILQNSVIDKESIKELYSVLSKGLLDDYSQQHMGEYYRKSREFINREAFAYVDEFEEVTSYHVLDERMNDLIKYINEDNDKDIVEKYIKSQVIHYYVSYLHPYFDVNGRIARVLSIWYLLNNNAEPCVLFNNRMLQEEGKYNRAIKRMKNGNITSYIKYSLTILKEELEKKKSIEEKHVRR